MTVGRGSTRGRRRVAAGPSTISALTWEEPPRFLALLAPSETSKPVADLRAITWEGARDGEPKDTAVAEALREDPKTQVKVLAIHNTGIYRNIANNIGYRFVNQRKNK